MPNYAQGFASLAYSQNFAPIVYAAVDSRDAPPADGGQGNESHECRSADSGEHWARAGSFPMGVQGCYENAIWADPTAPNNLLAGGLDMYRSTDGGATFEKVSDWANFSFGARTVHADQHVIVSAPGFNGTTNAKVYVGSDGGIASVDDVYFTNITNGWDPTVSDGLVNIQFYDGDGGDKENGLRIIGGTALPLPWAPVRAPVENAKSRCP